MSAKVDSVALYRMRKTLSELSNKVGRGTELVSVYIPPGRPLHEVATNLREEYGTAANIKSDTTRNHVQDALTRTMQRLKIYGKPPETGLAIFAGALPTNGPGSEVVKVFEIIPPKPIQLYLYRCDDHFHLDHLKDMLKEEKIVGILSMDSSESGLGIVSGDKFEVVEVLTSGVSGKHRAGGQSARRFERMREMELTGYYHRIAKHTVNAFLDQHKVVGIIVGGPGPTKEEFLKREFLDYRLQQNLISVVDTAYAGREGVRETFEKSAEVLQHMRVVEERTLVQRFLKEVNSERGLAGYGVKDVVESIKKGSADIVLVSDDSGLNYLKVECQKCGEIEEKVVKREESIPEKQNLVSASCRRCNSSERRLEEKDIVDYLADLALEVGTRIEVISSATEEGSMLKSFGGVAVILRYA